MPFRQQQNILSKIDGTFDFESFYWNSTSRPRVLSLNLLLTYLVICHTELSIFHRLSFRRNSKKRRDPKDYTTTGFHSLDSFTDRISRDERSDPPNHDESSHTSVDANLVEDILLDGVINVNSNLFRIATHNFRKDMEQRKQLSESNPYYRRSTFFDDLHEFSIILDSTTSVAHSSEISHQLKRPLKGILKPTI